MKKSKKQCGKFSPVHIDEFWRLRSEGWAYDCIAKKIGVSKWTCMDWRQFKTQPAANLRSAKKWGMA